MGEQGSAINSVIEFLLDRLIGVTKELLKGDVSLSTSRAGNTIGFSSQSFSKDNKRIIQEFGYISSIVPLCLFAYVLVHMGYTAPYSASQISFLFLNEIYPNLDVPDVNQVLLLVISEIIHSLWMQVTSVVCVELNLALIALKHFVESTVKECGTAFKMSS